MPLRVLMAGYLFVMAGLAAAFYAVPAGHMVFWTAIGVVSAAAMAVGVARHRPRQRLPWLVLAAGVLGFAGGDLTFNLLVTVWHQPDPFPSVADAFYLVTCVLQLTGMVLLARSTAAGRDRTSLLDSLVLTLGVGALSWIFLISPYVRDPDLAPFAKAVAVAYPLTDVLLLALVIQVVSTARRSPAVALLAIGTAGLLVSDVLYGLRQLGGSWQVGGPTDLGWIVLYAAWGAAALHPSMAGLTEPRPLRPVEVGWPRLALLALSSLIAPAVLLVEAARGTVRDGVVIAVVSALMFALVLARLAGMVNRHRQALARERGLREAGNALLLATDVAGVTAAVRDAVAGLLPTGTPHEVLFGENCEGPGEVALVPPDRLPAPFAERLRDFPLALCCPLAIGHRPGTVARVDSVVVAAAEPVLAVLQGPVEVLATKAALALERIVLADEINRRAGEEYFRTLVQHTPDIILIVDDDNAIRYASPAAVPVFGTEALVGVNLADLVEAGDRLLAVQLLDLVRSGGYRHDPVDWRLPTIDGHVIQAEVACRDLRADPTVAGLVVTLRDVTERRRLERELSARAFQDPLTGLANRVLFGERARQAVARSKRTGQGAGVMIVDLDDFKEVNDTLGHAAGDELLAKVGERLTAVLGPEHLPARLGGDEFAALIEDVTDPGDLDRLAARVLGALAEPLRVGTHLMPARASIGVAMVVAASGSEDLVRQADLALYAAKGAGKGQWRRYQSELHTAVVERLRLRAELDRAVEKDEFTLHYQPIVALGSGTAVGFEALVRWAHPERGLLAPAHFIGVAEETGVIVPIGEFVLRSAIGTATDWYRRCQAQSTEPPYLSVNVSARQFRTPGFVATVRRELAAAGLPARYLMLEITESLLLRDDEQVWSDLDELRAVGIRVAIDDFGTGYSSLSYLRQVPIDVLKIDKSFIDTAVSSPRQRALVDGIVRLADTLGLTVVAEGIERTADRDLLLGLGCRYGQGYLFARPMSYPDAVAWLFADRVAA